MQAVVIGLIICALFLLLVISLLWRHKKSASSDLHLIGERAFVQGQLKPEGSVIVGGELWPACSSDGAAIMANSPVRVIGMRDHLLVVEASDSTSKAPGTTVQ